MVMIRVWRNEADGITDEGAKITPCAVCSEPATHWSYDGLDPDEHGLGVPRLGPPLRENGEDAPEGQGVDPHGPPAEIHQT